MDPWVLALNHAVTLAKEYEGATSPNPPVGAAALNTRGEILTVAAHARAGEPHAEVAVFNRLEKSDQLQQIETLVVTLEPCSHFGQTPPCTDRILKIPSIKRVVYAVSDPNIQASGGAQKLIAGGLDLIKIAHSPSIKLSRAFRHKVQTGLPWVTVKTAFDRSGSMIPPQGERTFTSESSLQLAHELRRRSDVLVTGSGTVIADLPEFTVRKVVDHRTTPRKLVIFDRNHKTPSLWSDERKKLFDVKLWAGTFEELLEGLSTENVLEVLVEAGPKLTDTVLKSGLWNEQVLITQNDPQDIIEERMNVHWHHPKTGKSSID